MALLGDSALSRQLTRLRAPLSRRVSLFAEESPELLLVHLGASYRICNFRCEYCYLPEFKKKVDAADLARLEKLIDRLKLVRRPLHLVFATDGELTITRDLWPLLRKTLELPDLRLLSIFTNLSNDLVEGMLEFFPAERLAIIATYHHHQFRTPEKQKEEFFERVRRLKGRVASIVGNIVLSPAQLPQYPEFKARMAALGVPAGGYPLIAGSSDEIDRAAYTPGELAAVERILAEDSPAPINRFLLGETVPGLRCAAGRDYLELALDGTVRRCYALPDTLGNLFDPEGPRVARGAEPCPAGGCSCKWTVAFGDTVSREYKRVRSLYGFVRRPPGDEGTRSFEVADHPPVSPSGS
jgi:radical SAM family protein